MHDGPTAIGKYRVLRPLGVGGMGHVYLAEDPTLGRRVAIKILLPASADHEASRQRFQREARALAALNVPGVVTIHEIGEHDGREFIAMEFVEGRTLREAVAAGMPLRDLISTCVDVARALSAAHAAGILHRDVKPDNLMVTSDGVAKVVDFGLARRADEERVRISLVETLHSMGGDIRLTREGMLIGTPAYMAPEVLAGGDVSEASDVFALGIGMYELIAGRHPFEDDAQDATQLFRNVLTDRRGPSLVDLEAAPAVLSALVSRMMDHEPDNRPDMRQIARELGSLAARVSGTIEGVELGERPTEQVPVPIVTGDASAVAGRWIPGVLALGATAAVVGIWWALQPPELEEPARSEPAAVTGGDDEADVVPCVAVSPFDVDVSGVQTPPSDGIAYIFATLLRGSRDLNVVSSQELRDSLAHRTTREPRWEPTARGLGAGYLVRGAVTEADAGFHGTATLVDLEGAAEPRTFEGERRNLEDLLEQLATGVVGALAPGSVIGEAPSARVDALEQYEIGARALHERDWAAAQVHLSHAVELQPDFFEAWYHLALARSWAPAPLEQTRAAAERAAELARTERDRAFTRGFLAYFNQDYVAVQEHLRPLYENNPRDRDVAYVLGEGLYHAGRHREGIELFHAVLRNSPRFAVAAHHPLRYAIAHRNEDAMLHYARLLREVTDSADRPTADIAFALGRYEEAAAGGGRVDPRVGALTMLGRDAEARALVEQSFEDGSPERWLDVVARAAAQNDTAQIARGTDQLLALTRDDPVVERWWSLRHLGEILVAAGAGAELVRAVELALEHDTAERTGRWQLQIHALAMGHDVSRPTERLAYWYRESLRAADLERREDAEAAVEVWRALLRDPGEDPHILERMALRRNLLAAGRDDDARAECRELMRPPVYRPALIVLRSVCATP